MRPLREQVILITGATDGLGKAVALQLARTGATLLLHGHDEARGQQTLEEIRAKTGNTRLQWYRADFAALSQVRALAERLAREQERLNVLVNNAGIGTTLPGFSVPTRIAPIREAMARAVPRTELVELGYLSGYPLFEGLR